MTKIVRPAAVVPRVWMLVRLAALLPVFAMTTFAGVGCGVLARWLDRLELWFYGRAEAVERAAGVEQAREAIGYDRG